MVIIPYLLASDYRRHGSYQIAADSHTGRRDIQYDALHRMGLQSREPYVMHATLAPTLTPSPSTELFELLAKDADAHAANGASFTPVVDPID